MTTPEAPPMMDDDPHQVVLITLSPLHLRLITEGLDVQHLIKGHLGADLLPVVSAWPPEGE